MAGRYGTVRGAVNDRIGFEMNFGDIALSLRISDLIDIGMVAVVLYALIRAFRSAESRLVLVGLLALVPLFLFARILGLRLISSLFEVFLPVLLVILVVLFQEDLRRFLERVGAGSFLRRGKPGAEISAAGMDVILRSLPELARGRIGALVVVEGEESVARHLSGGNDLDAMLSGPLLKSIFDPHSAGHDGALVVTGARARRFAAHLPLSDDVDQLAGRGTRHAAALGLSERTDALCLVVSEERGTISAAEGGELRVLTGEGELARVLEAHCRRICPPPAKRSPLDFFRRRLPSKAAAAVLAVILWFFTIHEGAVEYREFVVPVTHAGLPGGERVGSIKPERVRVIVSGTRRSFYLVDKSDFVLTLKLFDVGPGEQEFTLTASDLRMPDALSFVNIVPRPVVVTVSSVDEDR